MVRVLAAGRAAATSVVQLELARPAAAALGALDELGEQPAAAHEVMLGELAIGAVDATGSRWCSSSWRSARSPPPTR